MFVCIAIDIFAKQQSQAHGMDPDSMAARNTVQREKSVTKIIILMTISFLTCWLPYAVLSLFAIIGSPVTSPMGAAIPLLVAKTYTCINPAIYIFFNKTVGTVVSYLISWQQV